MPYCVPADVKMLIHSELSDNEVSKLITDADIDLDNRLIGKTMSIEIKRLCSMRLAAVVIAQHQRGIFGENKENKSIAEWNQYVDDRVAEAKFGVSKSPKIYSTSSLNRW